MIDVINTRYGDIAIEDVVWHRGIIPLPRGTMEVSDKVVEKLAKAYGLDKKWDLVREFLEYCNIFIYSVDFSTSYTEFLYPGGPDLGFNCVVDWVEESISDDDIEDFSQYVSSRDRKFLKENKKNIEDFLEGINDIYYKMLGYLDDYIESLKEELYNEEEGD